MNRPIFTSLAPNQQSDDTRLAWRTLLQPRTYLRGLASADLQSALAQQLGQPASGKIWLHSSGRSALYCILQTLRNAHQFPPDSEVLLQAYTCNAVPNPVQWAGLKPTYVDVDPTTGMLSAATVQTRLTGRSRVLIIQHTLGHVAPIKELLEIARQHNMFVIEDCAHALGATYHGRPVGTLSDAAIFSFGRDKIISSVYGGALTLNTTAPAYAELAAQLDKHYEALPYPSRTWVMQQLFHPILFSFAIPLYHALGIGQVLIECSKRLHLISLAIQPGERYGKRPSPIPSRLPNALAGLALYQLKKLDVFHTHRQARAEQYAHGLAGLPLTPLPSRPQTFEQPAYLRYTVLTSQAEALLDYCVQRKIYLGDWYRSAIAPAYTDQAAMRYMNGSCPEAEKLAAQTINLPTHINITAADADRVIVTIKNFFSQS